MAPEEKSEIVRDLEKGREEFLDAAVGLSESQAALCPEAGRWSVLECIEHVTTVEERFLGRLESAPQSGAPPADKQKETELAVRVSSRAQSAQAPEPVRPVGRFVSLAEALEGFKSARQRTVQFAREYHENLYSLSAEHPRFGPLNGVELLVLIANHARRHAEQIREVRATLGCSAV
ncbi:MAG: hypothetical protein C5B51_15875 [Terriglobia bacterium]|nr:MAG: hypothetical protein C5B51_15875 [Terriglobia bacterium]